MKGTQPEAQAAEPVAEQTAAVETAEAVETATEVVEDVAGVDLLGDEAPDWLSSFGTDESDLTITDSDIADLSPEAMKVIASLRRQVRAERTAIDELKNELGGQRKSLSDRNIEMTSKQAQLYELFQHPELQKFLNVDPADESEIPAAGTADHTVWLAKQAARKENAEFMKALADAGAAAREKDAAAKAAVAIEQQREALKGFIAENPDFNDYRSDIITMRKEMNGTITAQDAYLLLKARAGKFGAEAPRAAQSEVDLSRARARKLASRGQVTAKPAGVQMPEFTSQREQTEWLMNNSGVMKQFEDMMRN